MTAELWLYKPCGVHGQIEAHSTDNYNTFETCGPRKVRLDPEQVVWRHRDGWYLTARDILDGLDEEEE